MAYYYSNSVSGYYLRLGVSESNIDINNNTSYLSFSLHLINGNRYFSGKIDSANGYVNGSHVYSGTGLHLNIGGINRETLLYSSGTTITHNSDGAKTVNLSFNFSASSGGWGPTGLSLSAAFPLTTIPRASTVSISNSEPRFGEQVQLTINSAVSSFTHKLQVGADKHINWTTIADGAKGVVNWTVPKSFASSYTTTDNVLWLWVGTYNNGSLIGEKYYYTAFRLKPSSDMLPSGDIEVVDDNIEVKNAFNVFCRGLSRIKGSVSTNTKYKASIKNIVSNFENVNYSGNKFTTREIEGKGNLVIATTLTDSRGATRKIQKAVNVYDYKKPSISNVEFYQNASSLQVTVKGNVDPVNGANSKKLIVSYKPKSDTSWSIREVYLTSYDFTANTTISNLDTSLTYDIKVGLSDKLYTTESVSTTGIPVISRLAGGKGVRLFGEAYEEGFWVGDINYTITDSDYAQLMALLG